MIAEDPGSHDLAAKIQFPLFIGPGVFPYGLRGKVYHDDLSHITCIFGCHRRSLLFYHYICKMRNIQYKNKKKLYKTTTPTGESCLWAWIH